MTRNRVIALIIVLSGLSIYFESRQNHKPASGLLPANVNEKVSYNEKTHTLTVQTQKGTITEYAKNPEVTITNHGQVTINRHLIGLESGYFVGLGYSDCMRVFLGYNFFHFGRFDTNLSVGLVPDSTKTLIRPYIGLSYNFYSNTSFNVGVDPLNFTVPYKPNLAVFLTVKF